MRIGILGGGIAGLASAHYLLEAGHSCVVVEASSDFGGLTSQFDFAGRRFDRFHMPIMPVDAALCGLLGDLGALDQLVWRRDVHTAVIRDGRIVPFDLPQDAWRLGGLGISARLRLIAITAYLTRMPGYGLALDSVPASRWLRNWLGGPTYEQVWAPLLEERFGEHAAEAPAYWVWTLLQRYRHRAGGSRGYPRAGYRALAERLAESIFERGGEILLDSRALGVMAEGGRSVVQFAEGEAVFDALISTLPLPEFAKIAATPLLREIPFPELPHMGRVTAAVISKAPITSSYTTVAMGDPEPFYSIENLSALVPTSSTGGLHVTYLTRSCEPQHEAYLEGDDVVEKSAIEMIARLYPDFDRTSIEHVEVSRAPQVEPIWTLGSLERRPPSELRSARVLLSTTAHAYPRMPSWDTSVTLARETVERLIR